MSKTIMSIVSDDVYEALCRMAESVSPTTTVQTLVETHLTALVVDAPTFQVMESRIIINRAIATAMEYEPGKIFNAKDIMPTDLKDHQFQGYTRHIHGALQKNGNFTKIIEIPSGLTKYRRN